MRGSTEGPQGRPRSILKSQRSRKSGGGKAKAAPSVLASVSGTNDRNRTLWRQGQDEKFDFRSRKLTHYDAVAKMARET